MSFPAVLYDHVPVQHESPSPLSAPKDSENNELFTAGKGIVSYVVSSIVHRVSVPRERQANPGNGQSRGACFERDRQREGVRKNVQIYTAGCDPASYDTEQGKNSRGTPLSETENEDGDSEPDDPRGCTKTSDDGRVSDTNWSLGVSDHETDTIRTNRNGKTAVQSDIEDDDFPLETIIEDIGSSYVLVPIPPPEVEKSKVLQALVTTTRASVKQTRRCAATVFRAKFWSDFRNWLLECLESYVRDCSLLGTISRQYDCETVVDSSGNCLILLGSCIDLDTDAPLQNRLEEGHNGEYCHGAELNVPNIHDEGSGSRGSSAAPSSSSVLGYKTIMVSAHDMLMMKQNGSQRRPDNDYELEYSVLTVVTTQDDIQRWKQAFWKLIESKARALYYSNQVLLRRSLRESQKLLNDYYKSIDRYKYTWQMLRRRTTTNRKHNSNHLITVVEDDCDGDPWTLVIVPQDTRWADGTSESEGDHLAIEMTCLLTLETEHEFPAARRPLLVCEA
eukprot:jgi/Psemu1/322909/estExt_fgenesh1_pg.C_470038